MACATTTRCAASPSPARATPSARASTGHEAVSEEQRRHGGGDFPDYPTPWMYDDPGRDVGPKTCDLWKPVIAAVHGMACGGAFYLLGEVEFIIAADNAVFFDPHVTYGMTGVRADADAGEDALPRDQRLSLLGVPTNG